MSIASEITRLQNVRADILQAIADKGVTVPADSTFDDCPALIANIPTNEEPELPPEYILRTAIWSTNTYSTFDYYEMTSNENLTISIEFQSKNISSTTSHCVYGNGNNTTFIFKFNSDTSGIANITNQNNSSKNVTAMDLSKLRRIKATLRNNVFTINDGVSLISDSSIPYSIASIDSIGLGGGDFYIYKISLENQTKKSILLPAQRVSDNAWGFYDIINNKFYTHAWYTGL